MIDEDGATSIEELVQPDWSIFSGEKDGILFEGDLNDESDADLVYGEVHVSGVFPDPWRRRNFYDVILLVLLKITRSH